jgi:manganese/zinc/iron transport system substrate-binding protein
MSKPLRHALVSILVLTALGLPGCAPGPDGDATGDHGLPSVVTTTNLVGDLARRVGGDRVRVESLMGPGVDPHLYKASESDVRRLAEADLILYNGLHLEGKMGDILVKMARSRPVVAVTDEMPEEELREPPEFAGLYDPHVWFDVGLWIRTIDPVVAALSELSPEDAEAFRAEGDAYRRELEALDAWIRSEVERIPPELRVLVTAHDAFGYFGRAYGMEVVGIQGISTLAEAGLRDVERVVDLVVERRIPAIFIESSVPRRTVEAVLAAARERGHEVSIGGELYSDSLGAADGPEGTYEGAVRYNVSTIVDALATTEGGGDR